MPRSLRKMIVKLRMLYCDIRGHHGKKWNYEPGDHYMGRRKRKWVNLKLVKTQMYNCHCVTY